MGCRRYILNTVQNLGSSGYIENHEDGSVNIFIQGESNRIDEFIDKARNPPKPVSVKEFKIREADVKPDIKYFEIKPGELWEEFHKGFGAMQSIFMEYWNEFKDYRQEFRGFAERTDENFKTLMNRYGEISEK